MSSKMMDDPRIDPRIKAMFGRGDIRGFGNVASRAEILAKTESDRGRAQGEAIKAAFEAMDSEAIAPSDGLRIWDENVVSRPDGNSIRIRFLRPDTDERLPCVYYIHGGAMASMSCLDGNYRTWGRLLAHEGLAVAMVDFRNSVRPSSVPEIAPFPAGLNDCVSGIAWLNAEAERLNISAGGVTVCGDSGGANLAIASTMMLKRENRTGLVRGLHLNSPCIAGQWPAPGCPSSIENNGIFLDLHQNWLAHSYGIDALIEGNPLAWPAFATADDVRGFPPTIVHVHECDPLRDEGVNFYRLLMESGVDARCRQVMGTTHTVEVFPGCCPDISRDTANQIAHFARH